MAPPPLPFSYHLIQALMSAYPPSPRSPDMGTQIEGKLTSLGRIYLHFLPFRQFEFQQLSSFLKFNLEKKSFQQRKRLTACRSQLG